MVDGAPSLVRRLLVQMAATMHDEDDNDDEDEFPHPLENPSRQATYTALQDEEGDGDRLTFNNQWLSDYFERKIEYLETQAPKIFATDDLDRSLSLTSNQALEKQINDFGRCGARSMVFLKLEMARIEIMLKKKDALEMKMIGSAFTGLIMFGQWYFQADLSETGPGGSG